MLLSLSIYFLPTIIGFATNRLNSDTIEAIKRREIKGNDKALAIVINVIGLITGFIPFLPFIAWCTAMYLVFKKSDSVDEYVYEPAGVASENTYEKSQKENVDVHISEELTISSDSSSVSSETEAIAKDVVAASLGSANLPGMMSEDGDFEYKSVPAPSVLVIKSNGDYDKAIRGYASLIDEEAVDGWDFFLIQKLPVTRKAGCIMALLGKSDTDFFLNMLVFRRNK